MQPTCRAKIIEKVKAYARSESIGTKKLQVRELYRIRASQDRVIIGDPGRIFTVIDAGPRDGIYKEQCKTGEVQKLTIAGKNHILLSEEDYENLIAGLDACAIMARIATI